MCRSGTGHPAAAASSGTLSSRLYSPSDPFYDGPGRVRDDEDYECEEEYEEDDNDAAWHYDCCDGDVD